MQRPVSTDKIQGEEKITMGRKFTRISLLLLVFIMGCSNSEAAIQTVIAPSSTANPIPTNTSIPTKIPTMVLTMIPTDTPSPTDTQRPKTFCFSLKDYEGLLYAFNSKYFTFSPTESTVGINWNNKYVWTDNGDFYTYLAEVENDCVVRGAAQHIGSVNNIEMFNNDVERYDSDPGEFGVIFLTSIIEALSSRSDGEDWFWEIWEEICIVPDTEVIEVERTASDGTLWHIACQNDESRGLFMIYLMIKLEE